jgi:hypothetical protein
MKHISILRIELIKFFTNYNIIIIFFIPLISALLAKITLVEQVTEAPDIGIDRQSGIIKTYSNAFLLTGLHYVAFSIMSTTGREFTTGILRKNIIDGYTRNEIIIAKIFNLLVHIVLTTALGAIGILIFLITENAYSSIHVITNIIPNIFSFILIFSAYGILALFLVVLIKDPIKSILAFVFYRICEKMLSTLAKKKWDLTYTEYLPTNVIDQMNELSNATGTIAVLILIYLLIALYFAFFLMSKCEL